VTSWYRKDIKGVRRSGFCRRTKSRAAERSDRDSFVPKMAATEEKARIYAAAAPDNGRADADRDGAGRADVGHDDAGLLMT